MESRGSFDSYPLPAAICEKIGTLPPVNSGVLPKNRSICYKIPRLQFRAGGLSNEQETASP